MSGKKLIEVGCGKGFFLEMLEQQNFDITGFDPTYEGKNPKISRTYFQSDTGLTADGLVLRHVLEHIPDPYAFLAQLREANGGKGLIYIEVPCFDWICTHKAWFDIFYEHVNYFRLIDMQRMFGTIIRSGHLFGGQYMYVVADLDTLTPPLFQIENQANFPEDFTGSLEYLRKIKSDSFIIWGGASKGVIFALLSERIGIPIEKVIDINPAKQEKYLPATGLRIEAPAQALHNAPENTTIFIMNSNYSDEIKNMSNNKFNYVEVDSV